MFLNALICVDPEQEELQEEAKEHVNMSSKEKYKDYTNKYDKDINLLVTIREGIKGELETILLYEQFVRNLNNSTLIKIINDITRDEKEHVEKLTRTLVILEKDNYGTL